MEHGILLSGADNIDFMIHGVFKSIPFFGHEDGLTTTHVCVLIVMLLIIGFAIAANRQMAKSQRSAGRFSECGGADRGEAGCHGGCSMGCRTEVLQLDIGTIFIFILVSNIWKVSIWACVPPTADYGVTLPLGVLTFLLIHYKSVQVPEAEGNLGKACVPLLPPLAADLAAH